MKKKILVRAVLIGLRTLCGYEARAHPHHVYKVLITRDVGFRSRDVRELVFPLIFFLTLRKFEGL